MTTGQTKQRAILTLLAVFVAGIALGFAGNRFYARNFRGPSSLTPQEYKAHLLSRLTKDLDLDEAQQDKVDSILDETAERFESVREAIEPELEAIRAERAERIAVVLNPTQRVKYEQFVEERRRRREEHQNRTFRGLGHRPGH